MENLTDVPDGTYVALPAELMTKVMNTLDLCVQALQQIEPQDDEQIALKDEALSAAFALISQHNELH